ncbi:MAG: ion channel [Planctomycetota bacterium]|jgi:hypothetical protein
MNQSNSQAEKPKDQPRFSQEQYDMLKRCSDSKNITEWNQWRLKNPREEIFLEGADFSRYYLKGAYLCTGKDIYDFGTKTNLSGKVHLKEANFSLAHLENSFFHKALLQNSTLKNAYLQNAVLWCADISGTSIENARVNGSTSFWKCKVNRYSPNVKFTDFSGVSLSSLIVEPSKKQRLEYNIRRKNWEEWYIGDKAKKAFRKIETKKEKFMRVSRVRLRLAATCPIRSFWWISDYGISTKRLIFTFFGSAFVFALLYRLFPNFVKVYGNVGDIRGLWHAVYFSVVTMTTLGFGDIAANPDSWLGQTLLMFQVILGYVLLGALVTRFAVLFTAGGPAGKFADEKEKKDKKQQEAR